MAFAIKLLLVSISILALMLFFPKKSDRAIDFYQSENPVKHASESEEKVYELQQQQQLKRSLEVETQPKFADKKELTYFYSFVQIDGKWFFYKFALNLIKTQTYLMTLWEQHLSLTLEKKWIPSIKNKSVKLTTYLQPKIHHLTDKSSELLYKARQILTPNLVKGFNVSYYYLEIYGKWFLSKLGRNLNKTQKWIPSIRGASVTLTTYLEPKFHYLTDKSIEVCYIYTAKRILTPELEVNRIMTIPKLHLAKKVQVSLESCTENVRHGFKKLVNLAREKIRKVTQRAFRSG